MIDKYNIIIDDGGRNGKHLVSCPNHRIWDVSGTEPINVEIQTVTREQAHEMGWRTTKSPFFCPPDRKECYICPECREEEKKRMEHRRFV